LRFDKLGAHREALALLTSLMRIMRRWRFKMLSAYQAPEPMALLRVLSAR
jgi:hypothetical protein